MINITMIANVSASRFSGDRSFFIISGGGGFAAPLPFAIFLHNTIGSQGKFCLLFTIKRYNFAITFHDITVILLLTMQSLNVGARHARKGVNFQKSVSFFLRAKQAADNLFVARDFCLKIALYGLGGIIVATACREHQEENKEKERKDEEGFFHRGVWLERDRKLHSIEIGGYKIIA